MKLTHIALAIAMAAGSASALAGTGPLDLSNGTAGFQNTPDAGSFTDVYTFSSLQPFSLSASVTSVVNGASNLDFSDISISGPGGSLAFIKTLGDPFELFTLQTGLLAAGTYSLTLMGMNSVLPASYGGNVSVSPVPEPESYALMLAGIGVIGFVAARRSRRN